MHYGEVIHVTSVVLIDINQTNIICNTIVICMIRYKFAKVVTYRSNLAIVFTASLLSGKRPMQFF